MGMITMPELSGRSLDEQLAKNVREAMISLQQAVILARKGGLRVTFSDLPEYIECDGIDDINEYVTITRKF